MKTGSIILALISVIVRCAVAAPSDKSAAILPASFSGWTKDAAGAKKGADPSLADKTDADVLKEYGFSDLELATYTREDRKIQVKAARFNDASGAYGAFTFYQQPQMRTESIGDDAASNGLRILFYRSNILVDVMLDRVTAMSAADLRTLAALLPTVQGNVSVLPTLPGDLPRESHIAHTTHYIVGPVATERLGVPVPKALVDFSKSPELAMGKYTNTWGETNLLLIDYHTPQIARERMDAMKAAGLPGGPFYFKRTGSIVVVVNGNSPENEAQALLDSVNWDANVTLTQQTRLNPKDNVGNLIVGVFILIGILGAASVISGLAFGGIRVIIKKLFPDKVFDRPDDVDIIRLNLK